MYEICDVMHIIKNVKKAIIKSLFVYVYMHK